MWRFLGLQRGDGQGDAGDGDGETAWRFLAGELADFIEENGMASETITQMDLAAAQLFIGSAGRITTTFSRIRQHVGPSLKRLSVRKNVDDFYDSDGGVIWAWTYPNPPSAPENANWYIAWGLRFPTVSSWWKKVDEALPELPHAFVVLHSDTRPSPPVSKLAAGRIPQGWIALHEAGRSKEELVTVRELHTLPPQPDEMTAALAEWIREGIEALIPILPELVKLAG